ncbi:hypothetical protein N8946_00310 [Pseudomonadales bacterium]|nr:hypothetical protein [Pseudomonadales bacterium]
MTTTILALGFRKDDLKHLDITDDKVLLRAMTLGELESILDIGEEIDTITPKTNSTSTSIASGNWALTYSKRP